MTATFPGGIKSFTTKLDGVDDIMAEHINSPQEEIVAIETFLLASPVTLPNGLTVTGDITASQNVKGRIQFRQPAYLTIASGVVSLTAGYSFFSIETEGGAASDDLDTINGGSAPGEMVVLRAYSSSHTVVMKDGTGNLRLAGDFSLDNADDIIFLLNGGVNWFEVSRSDNSA